MKDEIYKDSDVIIEDSAKGSTDKGAADGYDSYEEKACVEHAHGTKRSVWITDSAPVAMLEPMNATESRRPATARMQARCSTKEQRDRSVAVAYDTQQHAGNEQSPCACSDVRAYDSYRMQVSDHCWEPNTLFPAETACMDAVLEPMNARGWWRSRFSFLPLHESKFSFVRVLAAPHVGRASFVRASPAIITILVDLGIHLFPAVKARRTNENLRFARREMNRLRPRPSYCDMKYQPQQSNVLYFLPSSLNFLPRVRLSRNSLRREK
ncbi:hypothetical protein EV421DRAFT_1735869 [Armillaria borealis]|uniref:Uncharacterized protein n=1 Tax=Armillaria borealis TaxID=47425 RepID=A0AA39JJW0_9AGAR|nr:hypothetical protein EV421DRAFT_1735869 [Armillaria borealis]